MRIMPLQPPYDADTAATLQKWMTPGSAVEPLALFRILQQNPQLSERLRSVGAGILGKSSRLGIRDREILIGRVCARYRCEYEWGVHVAAFSNAAGLSPEAIAATVAGTATDPAWTVSDRRLIRLADELHDSARVSDELWEELAQCYSNAELLELISIVGFYHLISYVANASQAPLESWAARFP
jgi:4-carboxymuconolactone decarboxylase